MLGIHWARDFQPNARASRDVQSLARTSGANMTFHGGKIMKTAVTQAIFWGPSWASYNGDEVAFSYRAKLKR